MVCGLIKRYCFALALFTVVAPPTAAQQLPEFSDRTAQFTSGLVNDEFTKTLETADFNNDGLEDVVISRRAATPILLVNEAGVLSNKTVDFIVSPDSATNSNYAEAFDANGDSWTDLVFARLDQTAWLLINRGEDAAGDWLGFEPGVSLDAATNVLVIESGDVTGDGAEDLFVIEVELSTNKLLVNDGNGNFIEESSRLGGLADYQRGHSALLADTNGDSSVDIVYLESDLFLFVYYNDGDGNFTNQRRFRFQNSDKFSYIFGAADFNGDGRFDFRNYSNTAPMAAMSTTLDDSAGVPVYLRRQDAPMTRGNRKHGTTHMRDIDGDGDTDYVLSSMLRNFGSLEDSYEGMRTEIVLNAGVNSGQFVPFSGEDWSREESMDARIIDVNGDGDMDLFIAHPKRYGVYLANAPDKAVEIQRLEAAPSIAGTAVSVSAAVTATSTASLINASYQWDFGDGTTTTTSAPAASHVYQSAGRYLITATVQSDSGADQQSMTHRVHNPLVTGRSQSSSSMIVVNDRVWVVNPDHNSVSVLDYQQGQVLAEIPVGANPVAIGSVDDTVWVSNKTAGSLSVISVDTFSVVDEISVGVGSKPHGIVTDESNDSVYVVLEGLGQLIKIDSASNEIVDTTVAGDHPRHLAINADRSKLYVSRFITAPIAGESTRNVGTSGGGELIVINLAFGFSTQSKVTLPYNNVEDTDRSARGIPNYLMAPVLSPDGSTAFVPAKLDNIYRGTMRDGNAREHNMLVRSVMASVDLQSNAEDLDRRFDFDNNSPVSALLAGPTGNFLFVVHEASRKFEIFDVYANEIIFSTDVGFAPHALAFSEDYKRLFVDNVLSRTVAVYDVGALLRGESDNAVKLRDITRVSNEVLSAQVLLGKQIFHDAGDPALSGQKYISCAVCHSEGGHDGRVWDFSDAGEGLRNTIDLRGRGGVSHGNIHWTANFDEIHDFENDIREIFDGTGLLTDDDYETTVGTLDAQNPKAGLSNRLDALAAYASSLNTFSDSPYRDDAKQLTAAGVRGRDIFVEANCGKCHVGNEFTDSPNQRFHNIGTVDQDTGSRLGQTLVGNGLDTPTLRGLWDGAPYLHDGSAPDLAAAVLAHRARTVGYDVTSLRSSQLQDLVAYLKQIDGNEPAAILPEPAPEDSNAGFVVGNGGAGCVLVGANVRDPTTIVLILVSLLGACRRRILHYK